jgi:hypothetical protein
VRFGPGAEGGGAGLGGDNDFGGFEAGNFVEDQPVEVIALKLGGGKLAGGDVHVGNPGAGRLDDHGGQVIVLILGQQGIFHHRAGSDHPRHLARHQPVDGVVAHLLADGYFETGLNQRAM